MFSSADEVLAFIKDEDVKFVDIRFCDLPGVMQHFNVPAETVDKEFFTVGQMFDGSSIRGFQAIHESDMKLVPDPATAYVDPFRDEKTLVMNFSILDPFTDERYSRDPRNIAFKAEEYLKSTGIADTAYFGAEAEFYVFDDVRFETKQNAGYYFIDSVEAAWNTGREEEGGNRGYKTRYKGGYFPVSPVDHFADFRDKVCLSLNEVGINVERSHHEVGTAGQMEINYRFNTLLHSGDDMMKFKYVVKNEAWAAGKSATFMPKPLFGDNGSGMHTHQSLWKDGEPLFYDERGYGGLSDLARWYIGGLLKHAASLLAFTNPTINSYHRLVPGLRGAGQPGLLGPQPLRLRPHPDHRAPRRRPSASSSACRTRRPTRTFASRPSSWRGLDGIKNRIEPPEPVDKDLYELPARGARRHRAGPGLAPRGAQRARGRPRLPPRG